MNLYKNQYRFNSIRLPHQDYTQNSWYFVTICTYKKINYFGRIIDHEMLRSPIGETAHQYWQDIPQHHQNIEIDSFIIMPNHVHGIIIINHSLENNRHYKDVNHNNYGNVNNTYRRDVACNVSTDNNEYNLPKAMSEISPKAGSLSTIIRSYKAAITRWCRQNGYDSFAWQSRFYEHIIRNDKSLTKIREYIFNNPIEWEEDENYQIN
jgi:REP element-mobilizing transposase RayT